MGKQPSPVAERQVVVPQPKRFRGGKVKVNLAAALERVHASTWRPIVPMTEDEDELPLEMCFDGLMLGNGMTMLRGGCSWIDEGRPLSSASERSTADFMENDVNDDPLSDEELANLCAST
ncbi:hypothetical protein H310_07862 [Aphanomyces invadans]|uniref:Uncharacterized protein n=1 Tax=Aphanomyces invadans TaxID=157072 RepID=A0A024U2H8_9STRA|nr:hypothetical protein H310_07862 [Aphanomyces invadans]ETV99822.1 hypothetical protein H310_07862 [Aphanomyces invadans]RHY30993.1 hypothetical protein DYB32_003856 [Aphanomyces invadans]|eukprot:XP_008871598.1 hypothetical protein H310_07862 [Aphanomyces invadans]